MPEQKMLWKNWCDRYYIHLLDKCLNDLPTPPKPFFEMSEAEVHAWLQDVNFEVTNNKQFRIQVPSLDEFLKNMQSTDKTVS